MHGYRLVNAISATVPAAEAAWLAGGPEVASVMPDASVPLAIPVDAGRTGSRPVASGRYQPALISATTPAQPLCPSNPRRPLVEPEALA